MPGTLSSETGAVKEKVEVSRIGTEEKVEEKSAFLLFLYTTLSSETAAVKEKVEEKASFPLFLYTALASETEAEHCI
jgi:hypothetical protein